MADNNSVNYVCPKCSAPLSFLPGKDKVDCEYCGSTFEIKAIEELYAQQQAMTRAAEHSAKNDWDPAQAGKEWGAAEADGMQAFSCPTCGAEIVCDANTMATECCYCGNPTMMPTRFTGMLRPDFVIPFKKTKDQAVAALKNFYEGKRLLPDNFTAGNRIKEIQGLYVPFWLFDSTANGHIQYTATKVRRYTSGDDDVTETSYYKCLRSGTAEFEKIPADGSTKMDDTYMESIEPFDYSALQEFSSAYFTGYLADKYDVDAQTSAERANTRVESSMVKLFHRTMDEYDSYSVEAKSISKENGTVSYAMVPVWILTTKYEGKPYTFMMNGQTGKLIGSLPIDKGKLRKYSLMTFAASCIGCYILGRLLLLMM